MVIILDGYKKNSDNINEKMYYIIGKVKISNLDKSGISLDE
jgi:hypothetical protein